MAAYPSAASVPRVTGRVTEVNPLRRSLTDAGTPRFIDLSEDLAVSITITHPLVTIAERDTLMAFYATNKLLAVTLTPESDGVNYSLFFDGRPRISVARGAPLRRNIVVQLVGTEV